MIKKKLSVRDLFVLERFNGREVNYKIPEYEIEEFGYNYTESLTCLIKRGFMTYAEPKDALNVLTIPKLKEILRANGQKLSGKKDDLIARIITTCTNYDVPKVYAATEAGIAELEKRSYFFENKYGGYGFLNSEIESLEDTTPPENVLEQLFKRDLIQQANAHDYVDLCGTYCAIGKYMKKHRRESEALTACLTAIYLALTGMGNGDYIGDYSGLEYFFNDPLWYEVDKLKTTLNLSDAELVKRFKEAQRATADVPFSYFKPKDMESIILDRLRGEENLLEKYKSRRRERDLDLLARAKPLKSQPPTQIQAASTSSGSGCLVVVMIVLMIVLLAGCGKKISNPPLNEFVGDFNAQIRLPLPGAKISERVAKSFVAVDYGIYLATITDVKHRVLSTEIIMKADVEDPLPTCKAAIFAMNPLLTGRDLDTITDELGIDKPVKSWRDGTFSFNGQQYRCTTGDSGMATLLIGTSLIPPGYKFTTGGLRTLTAEEFRNIFNHFCEADTSCTFRAGDVRTVSGEVQNVAQIFFNDAVFIHMTIVKKTQCIREVAVITTENGDENDLRLARDIFRKMIAVCDEDAKTILLDLGMNQNPAEWWHNAATSRNGLTYRVVVLTGVGLAFNIGE